MGIVPQLCSSFLCPTYSPHNQNLVAGKKEGCKILIGFEYEVQLLHEIACSLAV